MLSPLEESQVAQVPAKGKGSTEKAVVRVGDAHPRDLMPMQKTELWPSLVFFNLWTIFFSEMIKMIGAREDYTLESLGGWHSGMIFTV